MSVFLICEQAVGLVRGKRLILSTSEKSLLESLNYEALTSAHAQDEAVVCALHFARVRDRLLQIYPWVFARKSATVSKGALPSDCLTVLAVLVNGEPVEYEQIGSSINITQSCQVHYTAQITDTDKWSAIFRDVFCYSLAIEINSAVTGESQYTQILEQKAQELILRAHQIGAIQAETKITLSQELYNRAIGLSRGQRTVKTTSTAAEQNGVDNSGYPNDRTQAEINACKRAADSVRDRLLESYAWVFARKSATVAKNGELPADCLSVLAVLIDGKPADYEITGNNLIASANAEVHYTARIKSIESWSAIFRDVFCYTLAQEITSAVNGNVELIQILEQKAQELIQRAISIGAIKAETKITLSQELYNRAIGLARGQRTLKTSSAQAVSQGVDNAVFIQDRTQAEIDACLRSSDSVRDRLLTAYSWVFARKNASLSGNAIKITGWDYAYSLPSDCLKVISVVSSDETIEFEQNGGVVYCNSQNPSVRYNSKITDISQWPGVFKDVFCYQLAEEIVSATTQNGDAVQLLEQKTQLLIRDAIKTGVIKNDTKLTVTQELYRRAIILSRGKRTLKPDSDAGFENGVDVLGFPDVRYQSEYQACKESAGSVRDRLLESYPWIFARKSAALTAGITKIEGWNCAYRLPDDCLKVLALIVDGESEEFEDAGKNIYCSKPGGTVRYTGKIENISEWPGTFRDIFAYQLAIDVVYATTGSHEIIELLEQKSQYLISSAYQTGLIQPETQIPAKDEIYNRAIAIAHGSEDKEENLTQRNRRENAVCRRSADYIRDRLLESHAWRFARKTAKITSSGVLPSDAVNVLIAKQDGKILEDGNYPAGCEIVYTSRITDIAKWDAVFKDAFCYALASEIVRSVKGDISAANAIEERCEDYIRQGYQIGAICPENRTSLEIEIYNRAINLVRGQRIINPASKAAYEQGADNTGQVNDRVRAEINACLRAADNMRDKLLQLYPWVFARKNADLSHQGIAITGWQYGFDLPDDCLTVLTVLSEKNGEIIPVEWEVSGSRIYSNFKIITVRYTARINDISQWPAAFADSFVYLLASEVMIAVTPATEATLAAVKGFEDAAQLQINQAQQIGLIRAETRLPLTNTLCERALGLLKGINTSEAAIPDKIYQNSIASMMRSFAGVRDKLLISYAWVFARKTATPALLSEGTRGWRYTFRLPDDCLKVTAVIAYNKRTDYKIEDENLRVSDFPENVELLRYETAGRELYANRSAVHVRYTSRIESPEEWDAAFTEAFCLRLAVEVALNTFPEKNAVQFLEQRYTAVIQEAAQAGLVREDTGLPLQRESIREGLRRLPRSLEYAGIPTIPRNYGWYY